MPKAVICRELGPPENLRLETFAAAPLAQGQVRVAIQAAGINFPDILMAAGQYQLKPPLPFTPGMEAAGDVVEVDRAARGVAVGDKVIVKLRHGAYADEAVVAPSQLMPLPSTFDYAEGATFLAAHGTAYHALIDRGQLQPGEVLLVHGAGGGVGLAAVEMGAAMGARVIAAASTDEKLALAKAHGAEMTINYTSTDLKTELKRVVPGGIDVVYDPVGGAMTEAAVRGLGWGGRLLVVGFANGEIPKLPLNLLLLKEAAAIGVFWGAWTQRDPAGHAANVAQLMQWFTEGKIRPHIGGAYPLAQAKDAIAAVMDRKAHGKIVIIANE